MEPLTESLLNDFQHDFPLNPAPFAQIAQRLNTSTSVVLARLRELQRQGTVSRVGPVFRPNTIGASTLARITSYNVCYTKLLRQDRGDRFQE